MGADTQTNLLCITPDVMPLPPLTFLFSARLKFLMLSRFSLSILTCPLPFFLPAFLATTGVPLSHFKRRKYLDTAFSCRLLTGRLLSDHLSYLSNNK
jgi:hypothetical protein